MDVTPILLLLLHCYDVFGQYQLQDYPQKPKKLVKKNFQLLLSKKYMKPLELKSKKPSKDSGYTVFPSELTEKKIYDVPDSFFFPVHNDVDKKTRVKKILEQYTVASGLRHKRSANDDYPKDVKDKKANTDSRDAKAIKKPKTRKHRKSRRDKKHHSRRSKKTNSRKANVKSDPKTMQRSDKKKDHGVKAKSLMRTQGTHNQNNKKVGSKDLESRRLIASRDALIEDYPYVVSIQKNDEHWCAGALLNPNLVITTANCVWKSNRMSRLWVRAGSRHAERGGQESRVAEVVKHPNWSIRKNPDNDVALLLLEDRIKFSNTVHGVDLPNRVMMPPFEDAWVTSWGAERRDGIFDKKTMTLQVFHARLIDRRKCNNITQRFGVTVTENFFCLSQNGRQAPCTRDTGAPAVSDGVVWGLASWGIRKLCGTERFPAMFSFLASQSNMDFIANATRHLMSDQRFYPFLDRFRTVRTFPTTTEIVFDFNRQLM